jgi:DNA-binding MarR family transcriptional regulator
METPRDIFLMQQTYATLFSLANKLQVKGDQFLKNFTARQFMTMIAIVHLPDGEASLNNIARKLGTTKQNVKQVVDLIEKKGYVVTMPSSRDKRAVNVVITQAGFQAATETSEQGQEYFHILFHDFTQVELETFWNLLKKLYRYDGEEQDGFEEEVESYNLYEGESK